MVVIFGWGAGQAQDLGEVAPTTCPNCHNQVFLHRIRSDKHVSLYFIPLVPYGSNEYLACPICRHGLQIHPDQQPAVARMHAATTAFRTRAITLEAYQPSVERFWQEVGVDPSGERVLHPPRTSPLARIGGRGRDGRRTVVGRTGQRVAARPAGGVGEAARQGDPDRCGILRREATAAGALTWPPAWFRADRRRMVARPRLTSPVPRSAWSKLRLVHGCSTSVPEIRPPERGASGVAHHSPRRDETAGSPRV